MNVYKQACRVNSIFKPSHAKSDQPKIFLKTKHYVKRLNIFDSKLTFNSKVIFNQNPLQHQLFNSNRS